MQMSSNSEDYFEEQQSDRYYTPGYCLIKHILLCARYYNRHFNLLIGWKVTSIPFNASGTRRISAASLSGYEAGNN